MWLPTKAQVDAATRHAISIAGTAIVIFGLQAKGVSVEQVTAAINALGSGINSIVLVLAALAPIYAGLRASQSASPTNQVAQVQAIANDPTQPAAQDAKQALIAATISLPEVQTIVADKETAAAAPSESVVAAEEVSVIPTK